MSARKAAVNRATKETDVRVEVDLDGTGMSRVETGFAFADHMLTLAAFWAQFDLTLACKGDLEIDAHHSLEDTGLTLGSALAQAMGDRAGIGRVGWARVPMDEALAEVSLDLSGRPYLVYDDAVLPAIVAGEEKDVWREFFKSLAQGAKLNLHIRFAYGQNGHHLLESAFKGLGVALRQALTVSRTGIPSTKGSLE